MNDHAHERVLQPRFTGHTIARAATFHHSIITSTYYCHIRRYNAVHHETLRNTRPNPPNHFRFVSSLALHLQIPLNYFRSFRFSSTRSICSLPVRSIDRIASELELGGFCLAFLPGGLFENEQLSGLVNYFLCYNTGSSHEALYQSRIFYFSSFGRFSKGLCVYVSVHPHSLRGRVLVSTFDGLLEVADVR